LSLDEQDLREAIRDVYKNTYDTEEVMTELNRTLEEMNKNKMEVPQCNNIGLPELSELNEQALSRATSFSQSFSNLLQIRKVSSSVDPPGITSDEILPCPIHGIIQMSPN